MDVQNINEEFSPKESLQVIADMIEKVQNDKLRKLAKKRVDFKLALAVFIVLNLMFIAIWYFTSGPQSYFWPLWTLIVFAFILLIAYLEAYLGTSFFSEDKEYEKLKSKQKK